MTQKKTQLAFTKNNMKTRRQTNAPTAMSDDEETVSQVFAFNGTSYATYQEMVDAKRQRNRDMLVSSGLLEAKAAVDNAVLEQKRAGATVSARGLKRSKAPPAAPLRRRKSSRLAGVTASGIYIESEQSGKFEIAGGSFTQELEKPKHYNNRINDGSELSISEAVELTGAKWVKDGTVESAVHFMKKTLPDIIDDLSIVSPSKKRGSPTSIAKGPGVSSEITSENLRSHLDALSLDDSERCVAKVVPERIYSVVCHPSPDQIIACAGDKKGHLGIWNVDQFGAKVVGDEVSAKIGSTTDGVHLFKPHSGCISSLVWNSSGTTLLSSSYDGSVRAFDANKQVFEEVFATYDDDKMYKEKLGYGTDHGYNSWIQSMEIDNRYECGKCFFLSTSAGGVIHIDLRSKGKVTFDQILSNKKINTVSLHPDGNIMATAGLSTMVQLWDVRKMPSSTTSTKEPKPLAWQSAGRSINSAFFSPSGMRLLTTTQSNTLDIFDNPHLASGLIKPNESIKHNNQTGRWLSTFMARWHPGTFSDKEMFVVGSMKQPRCIEVFADNGTLLREIRGDALTAVASRCCFHPSANKLIVVGGNSSGRVTVAR
mmetsp:Transcript_8604/g.19338  ORF Transcript_8604/g.19338 Transcript_8604/m.19338 type:complete len:596 (-) Transcript_8604:92-1879(-)